MIAQGSATGELIVLPPSPCTRSCSSTLVGLGFLNAWLPLASVPWSLRVPKEVHDKGKSVLLF